jgi:hypothetical protein
LPGRTPKSRCTALFGGSDDGSRKMLGNFFKVSESVEIAIALRHDVMPTAQTMQIASAACLPRPLIR